MSLTYAKALIAAVLEPVPTRPTFRKGTPWRDRLAALRAFRLDLARWEAIGKLAPERRYREVRNAPDGAGTLRGAPRGISIVHTQPNRAMRRRAARA